MNLIDGIVVERQAADQALEMLEARVLQTLSGPRLGADTVIAACDRLVNALDDERYESLLGQVGVPRELSETYIKQAKTVFSAAYLRARLEREYGAGRRESHYLPPFEDWEIEETTEPLGVLLHIAAGNADGLPAFSVLEGLLTGNINILKLPEVDGGVSVLLLQELIAIEPRLSPYIYVFDYSSRDIDSIDKLVRVADGVVVWGGDAAVSAMRCLIPPHTKLIEWGHKVSFAFVTEMGATPCALTGLARHICTTKQLLCSSCQGIFVDTDRIDGVVRFCERFLPILQEASQNRGCDLELGMQAQVSLRLYNEQLESLRSHKTIFRAKGCSLIAAPDSQLEPSIQFGNCWVKPLPKGAIITTLRPHKNHLQTVGLLCAETERGELIDLFRRAGVVRITQGEHMSSTYCGAAHDGEYPLRRYSKLVSVERAKRARREPGE